ncbi:MAG: division/cell wall cluster transcriptional repressor MraZ [Propionibacteriaceae bacterium]|jgi:MraZ protein|nr:division/cell wall cluster transcriptional repressor MraZ [Propionibacteriaceae bacterium]
MFLGTFALKLDEKGRFFLPPKFRDAFKDGLVVTRSQDRCLSVFTTEAFEARAKEALSAADTRAAARSYQRMLASGASDDVPDKQGRVSIPQILRDYAALERDIVVSGALDRLEVWNPEAFDRYTTENEPNFAELDAVIFTTD